jgi:hypothetical protein
MTLIAVNLRVAQEVPNLTSGVRGSGEDQDAANDEPTKGFDSTRSASGVDGSTPPWILLKTSSSGRQRHLFQDAHIEWEPGRQLSCGQVLHQKRMRSCRKPR